MAYEYTFNITRRSVNTSDGSSTSNSNVGNANTQPIPRLANGTNSSSTSSLVSAMLVSQAKSVVQYSVGKVGLLTGNSNLQQDINLGIEAVSLGVMAVVNPALAIGSIALNLGTTALENYYDNKKMNIQQRQKLAMAGYNDVGEIIGRKH